MLAPLALATLCLAAAPAPLVLDDFEALKGWSAHPAEGVELRIGQDRGFSGQAMRLDFDFHGGAGYAIARKAFPLKLPAHYELSFRIRADAPVNDLELKLVDASGENVWWMNRRRFDFPREWTRVRTQKRQIEFAWGPRGGGDLDQLAQLELVVTAGTGGKGTVWIDDLTFREREPPPPGAPKPEVRASSSPEQAARAMDGDLATAWRSAGDGEQSLALDLGLERELGGLSIDWGPGDHATSYAVETSEDGRRWEEAYRAEGAPGGRELLPLPETEARWLRLRLARSARGRGYAVREIGLKPPEWSLTPNDFFANVAKESPRGRYPRYLTGEQSYWTVVGVNGDTREALINTDGTVETGLGGPSLEPFLVEGGHQLITWADVKSSPSLARGYLPIPSVAWDAGTLRLSATAFASGEPEASTVYARYRVENRGEKPRRATLYLALRPFQVNPPWQFLNVRGGVARVKEVAVEGSALKVNGERAVVSLTPPGVSWASSFDQGNVVDAIAAGRFPRATSASDPRGYASAAFGYPLDLPPGGASEVVVAIPLHPGSPVAASLGSLEAETIGRWEKELDRFTLRLPPAGQPLADAIKAQLAYILINRDGPSLQPGSRAYDRSWIRDGLLTSAALLRLGHPEEVRAFAEWYAPHQRPTGYVPCCVSLRGADPVPEHDSHGQLISLVAEDYRFSADRAFLERMWPHVKRAVAFIDSARHQAGPFRGLLPESISHEGYSARPMHSYWDDFFALNGLEDAVFVATALGKDRDRARFATLRDRFRRDVLASLRQSMAAHHIDYLPGCAELGDFDATSTTVALSPLDGLSFLPRPALEATFERYYRESIRARLDGAPWVDFTPYEWRAVGAFVRLGWKARALEAVDLFLRYRRPPEWNHWAEVVFRDPATPRFIGDMPHTWVGSELIRSALDLFAYERASDQSLVVGAGIPAAWASDLEIGGVRTRHGPLSLKMSTEGSTVRVQIGGGLRVPPGGIIVRSPLDRPVRRATVNGREVKGEVVLREVPAEVLLEH